MAWGDATRSTWRLAVRPSSSTTWEAAPTDAVPRTSPPTTSLQRSWQRVVVPSPATTPSQRGPGGQAIVDRAMDAFGRLDIVINNAGILRNARFELLTDEQIDAVIDTHLKALFYVSQPAYRIMIRQGYGRFVFTSSGAGMFGNGWQANYGAAKAATTGLMQVLAIEGRRHGIVANAVIPGAITRLNDDVDPETARRGGAAGRRR
jgi:NAD(P)-dependent dehydrogenase (short-subunit alcohol dehydrogenase family)